MPSTPRALDELVVSAYYVGALEQGRGPCAGCWPARPIRRPSAPASRATASSTASSPVPQAGRAAARRWRPPPRGCCRQVAPVAPVTHRVRGRGRRRIHGPGGPGACLASRDLFAGGGGQVPGGDEQRGDQRADDEAVQAEQRHPAQRRDQHHPIGHARVLADRIGRSRLSTVPITTAPKAISTMPWRSRR